MIEILAAGSVASVQDLGRTGARAMGVGEAGAMDRLSLQAANLLAGNPPGAAAIETAVSVLRVRFTQAVVFAVAGAPGRVRLDGLGVPSFWAMSAQAGQVLEMAPSSSGMWSYLAVAGGVGVAPVLGSRSTDLKSGFGGLAGRALAAGDLVPVGPPPPGAPLAAGGFGLVPPAMGVGGPVPIRAIPAREYPCFTPQSQDAFWEAEWQVQTDSNRIGYRLAGPALHLREPLELLSYGLVPGVVQVPPSGQPVVQLSEANTCGGYPKMAVLASADIRLLAQTRPGRSVRFVPCTRDAALDAARDGARTLAGIAETVRQRQAASPR